MKIYQVYFNKESKSKLQKCFTPYNNTHGDPNVYEYGVMRDVYKRHDWEKDTHLGVVSWKFEEKIKHYHDYKWKERGSCPADFKSSDFVKVCEKHKDNYDVIHMNPFGHMGGNIWIQAELHHPGIVYGMQRSMRRLGINPFCMHLTHDYKTLCYCNYFVANKRFWDLYMKVIDKLHDDFMENPIRLMDSEFTVYSKENAYPFALERMFSTILKMNEDELSILPLGLSSGAVPRFCVAPKETHSVRKYLTK